MTEPDLIQISGRESMLPSERAALLAADIMQPPFTHVPHQLYGYTVTQSIHYLKLTIGWIRNTLALYERAVSRGQTDETLAKGADRVFSAMECYVLAWRRGGHAEFARVWRTRIDLDKKGLLL